MGRSSGQAGSHAINEIKECSKRLINGQGFSEFLLNEMCDVSLNVNLVAIKPLA